MNEAEEKSTEDWAMTDPAVMDKILTAEVATLADAATEVWREVLNAARLDGVAEIVL